MEYVRGLLAELGMNPDRVQMFNLSSAMAPAFAEMAATMEAVCRDQPQVA